MRRGWSSRSSAGPRSVVSGVAATLALAVGLAAVPVTTHASTTGLLLAKKKKKKRKRRKKDGLTPEQAADRRMPIQDQGMQMIEIGELTAATILFDNAAQTQGDPVLFLDAGEVHLRIASEERDIAAAETAKMRGQTAQDILYFHLDSSSDPDYRLVTNEEASGLLARASQLIDDADTLIAELEAEQEALANPEPAAGRKKGNGRGLRLAGFGFMGLGVAGLGAGIAGLTIGRINQNRVNDRTVYGTTFDEFDAKGRRGNVIAGVGLAIGGIALATGVTLFIIGNRRQEAAADAPIEDDEEFIDSEDDPSLAIVPTGRGLAITGRF